MGDRGFELTSVDWTGRHVVAQSETSADGWDESDLIALRHDGVPGAEFLVDGAADRFSISLEGGMRPPQGVVNVRQRRARGHLESLRFEAGLLSQSSEQPHANGNRYRHKAILVSDEDMDFFARVQGSLDSGASSFGGAVPERDQHVARVDEALVAGCGLARARHLLEWGRHH